MTDPRAPRPSAQDVRRSWLASRWEERELDLPGLDEFHRALDEVHTPNTGDTFSVRITSTYSDEDLAWFIGRGQLQACDFFVNLVMHPDVREALARLSVPDDVRSNGSGRLDPLQPVEVDPEHLVRDIFDAVHHGGVYKSVAPERATRIAHTLAQSLLDERPYDVRFYEDHHQWTPWFSPVKSWTLFAIDLRKSEVTILAATDED